MVAFENAGTPKVPYLQPYLRQLKSIDAAEAVKSDGDGGGGSDIDLDEKEQQEERDAMLEVIDEIEIDVSILPVTKCCYSTCAEHYVEFGT